MNVLGNSMVGGIVKFSGMNFRNDACLRVDIQNIFNLSTCTEAYNSSISSMACLFTVSSDNSGLPDGHMSLESS